jgi:hypothetical protein
MATFLAVGIVLALGLHTVRSALDLLHLATLRTYRQQLAIYRQYYPGCQQQPGKIFRLA